MVTTRARRDVWAPLNQVDRIYHRMLFTPGLGGKTLTNGV